MLPVKPSTRTYAHATHAYEVKMHQLFAAVPRLTSGLAQRVRHSHLLESAFDLHALCPGHRWVGQAVAAVSTSTHVYPLLVKEAEGLGHHVDGVVGES